MLVAYRNGGRASLIDFAEAWDRVAFRGQREARARRATERELLILRSHLEASLLQDDHPAGGLATARREHEALLAGRERSGDPHRVPELEERPGWAWTRLVRRYDDYASLIRRVEDAAADAEPSAGAEPARPALTG
jgi:hypothetical protein